MMTSILPIEDFEAHVKAAGRRFRLSAWGVLVASVGMVAGLLAWAGLVPGVATDMSWVVLTSVGMLWVAVVSLNMAQQQGEAAPNEVLERLEGISDTPRAHEAFKTLYRAQGSRLTEEQVARLGMAMSTEKAQAAMEEAKTKLEALSQ